MHIMYIHIFSLKYNFYTVSKSDQDLKIFYDPNSVSTEHLSVLGDVFLDQ